MRKLKRKVKKVDPVDLVDPVNTKTTKSTTSAPHKIKRYKKKQCDFIRDDGRRCKRKAVGKGTLCKLHGGNPIVQENLIPAVIENRQLFPVSKYRPDRHPIEFVDLSRQGSSEVEIAALFGVSVNTIKSWAEKYESFSTAYEIGQAMHEAWWIIQGKNNLTSRHFNTNLFKFLTSNKLGYSDKMETKAMNLNIHGVLKVPDSVTEDEWEAEIIDEDS